MAAGVQVHKATSVKANHGSLYQKVTGSVYLTAKLKRTIMFYGNYGPYYRSQALANCVKIICINIACVVNTNLRLQNMTTRTVNKIQTARNPQSLLESAIYNIYQAIYHSHFVSIT